MVGDQLGGCDAEGLTDPVDEFEVGIELAGENGLQALEWDADHAGDRLERQALLEGEPVEVRCEDLVAAAVGHESEGTPTRGRPQSRPDWPRTREKAVQPSLRIEQENSSAFELESSHVLEADHASDVTTGAKELHRLRSDGMLSRKVHPTGVYPANPTCMPTGLRKASPQTSSPGN